VSNNKYRRFSVVVSLLLITLISGIALAGTDGSISGSVFDEQGIAISQGQIELFNPGGQSIAKILTSTTGDFNLFPVTFGDYNLAVKAPGYNTQNISLHVASGSTTSLGEIRLSRFVKELVLNVEAKKHLVKNASSGSSAQVSKEDIASMPQGENIKLPKLLTSTMAGTVQGAFGQTFIRGNHANIQYQIDGVQLPDSPSNTFGESFTPRNIDHMEFITGGVAAEYGERLAGVVNIVTKSGTETPGGAAEINYGTYNTYSPWALYSGSNSQGDVHYYISGSYFSTDRGLDTPQPTSESDRSQGGADAIHDQANGNNEFAKIDWIKDNSNKFSVSLFNSYGFYQIPNYPANFLSTDAFFNQGFTDSYGNGPANFTPSYTDDNQYEYNSYVQLAWRHTLSDHSFLLVAPYFKYSYINVKNDLPNDLFAADGPAGSQIAGSSPSSFSESRNTNNLGVKTDFTDRLTERHLFKSGLQVQNSQSGGFIKVVAASQGSGDITSVDSSGSTSNFESVYAQDDFTISKSFSLNAGLRFDVIQNSFGGGSVYSSDNLLQPRVGLNYFLTDTTKFHIFYGKLFQPAPAENLRDSFTQTNINSLSACPVGQICPYDIKSEKDDYYEVGVDQQWGSQLLTLTTYYKDSVNQLDDAQLLNTSIAQPFNFQKGFAYGTEFSVRGKITERLKDFLNYSYEIAKGQGIGGGIFAFTSQNVPGNDWQYLDHVQLHTLNGGVTYSTEKTWWTTQALYGSGLRTGPSNINALPAHLTFDTTLGYTFSGELWYEKFKVSVDALNIFNNTYPISIANGFNGSHYAAGREFFLHLSKDL
jgi:outer membrane cobalamin receptor